MGRRKSFLAVVGVVAIAGLLSSPSPAGASFPGNDGPLAVVRNGDIWTMTLTGRLVRQLTATGKDDFPQWSPDGKRIAFMRYTTGHYQVFTMNADGSAATQVTTAAANQYSPTWSPDGRWLAFVSDRGNRRDPCGGVLANIFKLRSTVPYGAAVQVTDEPGLNGAVDAAWSPDGKTILAEVWPDTDCWDSTYYPYFRTVSVATGAETSINLRLGCTDLPDWAPGAKKIAFWATNNCPGGGSSGGPYNLYQANPDGTALVQLTHYTNNTSPSYGAVTWAPNGGPSLVFTYFAPNQAATFFTNGVYQINANGTGLRTIKAVTSPSGQPAKVFFGSGVDWQPLP